MGQHVAQVYVIGSGDEPLCRFDSQRSDNETRILQVRGV